MKIENPEWRYTLERYGEGVKWAKERTPVESGYDWKDIMKQCIPHKMLDGDLAPLLALYLEDVVPDEVPMSTVVNGVTSELLHMAADCLMGAIMLAAYAQADGITSNPLAYNEGGLYQAIKEYADKQASVGFNEAIEVGRETMLKDMNG